MKSKRFFGAYTAGRVLLFCIALVFASLQSLAQSGADLLGAWTGTVNQTSLQVSNLPSNGKVIQLTSSITVATGASFKVVDGSGNAVSKQADLSSSQFIVVTSGDLSTSKTYSLLPNGAALGVTPVNNANTTVSTLANQILQISGASQYRITNATNPLQGSVLHLNGENVWLYFDSIRPSAFNAAFLDHVFINGQKPVADTTVRIVQWLQGCAVISQPATYQALEIFDGQSPSGASKTLNLYDYNRSAILGSFENNIASFRLKKGYMATFAENENGTGKSQIFIASDSDIVMNAMPLNLQGNVSFIRVLPWRWVAKKGWTSGYNLADTLRAAWNYNWNNNGTSTLDQEYVPVRQTQYWPVMSITNAKHNTTAMLSFNEPNSSSQANMTPDQAIANWSYLQESGLRLGAPAITDGGYSWMSSFITKADSAGLRVDFIGVHFYRGCQTAAQFYSFLKSIYDICRRPLWVTEWNNGANWTTSASCPQPTYAEQAATIASFMNMLDTATIVERYSLYEWVQQYRQMFNNTAPIVLNPAGAVYRDKVSPMANIPQRYNNCKTVQLTAATTQSGVKAPVLRIEISTTGTSSPLQVLRFSFNTNGTTAPANITNAKLYFTGTGSAFSTTNLVGQYDHPNGAFDITAVNNKVLGHGTNYFWLTYDVDCGVSTSNVLDAEFTGFYSNVQAAAHVPAVSAPAGAVAITAATTFSTVKDGDWSDASVWACGTIPSGPSQAVTINNHVRVTTPVVVGNVSVTVDDSLIVTGTGTLTLGASSMGSATGNSNKVLSVSGILVVEGGTLNVNGALAVRSTGALTMAAGTINIDGNDGTAAGSVSTEPPFYILSSRIDVTGGAINILDPAYSTSTANPHLTRAFSYENTADAVIGEGCTVIFGGGDDVNPSHTRGFYVTTGAGTAGSLTIGNGVMAGGRGLRSMITNGNTVYISKFHHLNVNAGAEILVQGGPLMTSGNLVNNGVITSTVTGQGQWLVFAGDSKYGSPVAGTINYTASESAQTLSGTGYFKHQSTTTSNTATDPTAQTGNYLSGITVYHSAASPGLSLNVPLTVGALRLMGGKLNTTPAAPLQLGNGTSLPGNPVALTATAGTLYQFTSTGQATGTSPATGAAYSGGWINGPFSRYVTATTTSGQGGVFPIGGTDTVQPAQITFTAAPTTAGYLTAQWFPAHPGTAGLPLNEPAVTPAEINAVAPGYWQVIKGEVFTGGTYKAAFTNNSAGGVSNYANTVLLKRSNTASPWTLQGAHVAATGSNASVTVSRDGLTGFSEFAIGGNGAVLPVTFQYLKGSRVAGGNLLTWKVTTTSPLVVMDLERSSDARRYQKLTTITATQAATARPFSYQDAQLAGGILYYRLKLTDADGKVSYSPVVALTNAVRGFELIGLYPTVLNTQGLLSLSAAKDGRVKVVVSDALGRTVQSATAAVSAGSNLLTVDASRLAGGGYLLSVVDEENGETKTVRFVVSH